MLLLVAVPYGRRTVVPLPVVVFTAPVLWVPLEAILRPLIELLPVATLLVLVTGLLKRRPFTEAVLPLAEATRLASMVRLGP